MSSSVPERCPRSVSLKKRVRRVLPVALTLASGLTAQTTKVPSTLRHGSGLMDVPVAGVLAHRALTVSRAPRH